MSGFGLPDDPVSETTSHTASRELRRRWFFRSYIRCYWPEQATIDGTWKPPIVEKVK